MARNLQRTFAIFRQEVIVKAVNDRTNVQKKQPAAVVNIAKPPARGMDQVHALLYEALETEKGGVLVYEAALSCAINDDLRQEWEEYLEQTRNHVTILMNVLKELGLNPDQETPGRNVVRFSGQSLVRTIEVARMAGKPEAAQIVAAECVVQAETKDHMNWELLGIVSESLKGSDRETLRNAVEQVEDEEDEHLYHTKGWTRELHLQALGLPAELPPAEEKKDVSTAMEAATVMKERKESLTSKRKGSEK